MHRARETIRIAYGVMARVQRRTLDCTRATPFPQSFATYVPKMGKPVLSNGAAHRDGAELTPADPLGQSAPALSFSEAEVQRLGEGDVLVRDGLLGAERALRCAEAVRFLDASGALVPARMGRARVLRPELRGDRRGWIDPDTVDGPLRELHARFHALREALNRDAWLGLRGQEVQVACYPGGGARYAPHRDAIAGEASRRVTAICYLNPCWSEAHGGALRVQTPAGVRDIAPILDRCVIFLSDRVVHEVLAVHAPRFAVTAWLRGPSLQRS